MFSRIKQLDDNKLLCLSSNGYYLNIIEGDSLTYRIDTQDPIVYFGSLSSSFFLQNSTSHANIFIVIDRKLHWNIFILQDSQPPQSLFQGTLSHFNSQDSINYTLYQSLEQHKYETINCRVVNVHQTRNKLILILDNFQIYQLLISKKHKQIFSSFLIKKQPLVPIRINSQIIYPQSQSPYLTNFYLPSPQTNIIIDSLFLPYSQNLIDSNSNSNQQSYLLYLVLQSKTKINKGNDLQKIFSIYQSIFYPQQRILLSGKQSFLNIQNQFLGIYTLGGEENHLIVQTEQQIYLWRSKGQKYLEQSKVQKHLQQAKEQKQIQIIIQQKYKLKNSLTVFKKDSETQFLFSIVKQNKNNQKVKQNKNKQEGFYRLIKISFKKDKGLIFQQLNRFQSVKEEPLLFFINSIDFQQSYIFYGDYSIKKIKNEINNDFCQSIFSDYSVTIEKTKFVSLEPWTNILYLMKKRIFSENSVILTNSFMETNRDQYEHNLPIRLGKVVHISQDTKQKRIMITSPVIGSLVLNVSKINSNDLNIKVDQHFKLLSGYQTLAVSQSFKTFIHPHQIVFDLEPNKLGKLPSLSIGKIFESSTDFVEKGVILQKSGLYVMSLQDQLHVFEGNNEKSFKRKFIHCFRSHIKQVFKLNDVNVIGVQLYQSHTQNTINGQSLIDGQNMDMRGENDNNGGQRNYGFEVYLIKQERVCLLNKVRYGDGFTNCNPLSFLTHINTVPYHFTCIYNKLLLVSSQQTHRYNPQKVKIQIYDFPSPLNNYIKLTIIPLINLSIQTKNNPQNQFLLLIQQNHSSASKIFIVSLMKKFLIKNMQEIKLNYESVVSCLDLMKEKAIFSTIKFSNKQNERSRKLMILTQKNCYNLGIDFGKIQLSQTSLLFKNYIASLIKLNINDNLQQYQGVQKIQKPFKVIQKQVNDFSSTFNTYPQSKKISNLCEILLINKFQVWYCHKSKTQKIIKPISLYTMVNNDFLQFRNNLSVQQLEQPQFIKLFSQKLPIIQVKYLNNNSIIVLFQRQITVLQIGQNGSLMVKQEILFSKISNLNQHQNQLQNKNQYSSIKIIQLLDKCSDTDIFLKDAQGRLYLLVFDKNTGVYSIKFDRNLQQDIVSIIRTNFWVKTKIPVPLVRNKQINQLVQTQEIVVKKDSQLIIKDLKTGKQKSQYV